LSKNDMTNIRYLCLVFGDQLNLDSLLWQDFDPKQDQVWMAEVMEESTNPLSSNQRSLFFLAAMRHFANQLRQQGITLHYIHLSQQQTSFTTALTHILSQLRPQAVKAVIPGDNRVSHSVEKLLSNHQLRIEWLADAHFIAKPDEFTDWISATKRPRMEYWYRRLRKSRNILMDPPGRPTGGQWNYDKDNRRAFTRQGPSHLPPQIDFPADQVVQEVTHELEQFLPQLPGSYTHFNWPVTRDQALQLADHFINHCLPHFGDYQDAMWTNEPWLYHSRLAASLNIKLLSPLELINKAQAAYHQGLAPLNAVEGFIRQLLGWREYMRGLYWHYRADWLNFNALQAQRSLPAFYWTGKTGMVCLQHAIGQVLDYGYGHHIQRLMVTGLFALLWAVHPPAIHQWYLAMYVDAVAWVEIPNTLGMSQFADDGLVGSKPYIASGAYIQRMSNYCCHCPYQPKLASGKQACPFTTLFWHFIDRHRGLLVHHPRLAMQVVHWDKKTRAEQTAIKERAQWLFNHIDQV
jgi:deoxyribodipyrimidine photolyase-related protein